MRNRSFLPLLAVLLLLPTAASAQLRFQPPLPASRLTTLPLFLRATPFRIAIADTVRRRSDWQEGFWMGAATGAALGTRVAATYG